MDGAIGARPPSRISSVRTKWDEIFRLEETKQERVRHRGGTCIAPSGLRWADRTGELTEPKVHPVFVPVDKKIDDKKMGRIPRSKGTFLCHQCFCLFSSETHILVSPASPSRSRLAAPGVAGVARQEPRPPKLRAPKLRPPKPRLTRLTPSAGSLFPDRSPGLRWPGPRSWHPTRRGGADGTGRSA